MHGKALLERLNAREVVMGDCQPNIQGGADDGLRHGERTFRKAGGSSQDTGGNVKCQVSSSSWRLEKEGVSQLDTSDVLQAWTLSLLPAPHSSPSALAS